VLGNLSYVLAVSQSSIVSHLKLAIFPHQLFLIQDFRTLSIAAAVLYSFFSLVPLLVYFGLKRLNQQLGFVELMTVYGYSLAIFVPVSVSRFSVFWILSGADLVLQLIMMAPIEALRWTTLLIAFALSVWTVLQHVLSRLPDDGSLLKQRIFIALISLPHAALALYVKFEHFARAAT
jgi:hypothetical protein